jgi:hypothetical protein
MKKKLFMFAFLACMTLSAWCQGEYTTLVVEMNDGSSVNYILSQKPQISMGDQIVRITTGDNGMEVTYPDTQLKRFSFRAFDPVKIEETELPEKVLKVKYVDGQSVVISGTEATDRIALYTLNGQQMQGGISVANGETTIDIASLPKGVYIINVSNNQSFKILKR